MKNIVILLVCSILFVVSINAQVTDIFRDDFNDNKKGWAIARNMNVSGGHYNIHCLTGYIFQTGLNNIPFNYSKDYFIETRIKQSDSELYSSGGIVWGYKSKENALIFKVSSKGWFKILGFRNNVPFDIKGKTDAPKIIRTGDNYNTISIRKTGNTLNFYINKHKVYTSADYPPFGSFVGLIASNRANIHADYFLLRAEKRTINLVTKNASKFNKENMGKNINSSYDEIAPVIAPDGKTLYIARANHPQNEAPISNYDIWFSKLNSDGTWSKLKKMPKPLNNAGDNVVISVSPDNNTLFLETLYNNDGSYLSDQGISVSYRTASGWSIPKKVNIKNFYNKDKYESYTFSPNKKVLLMSVERDDSYGNKDMYVSFLMSDGSYSIPKNMGPVLNSYLGEGTPYIAPDNKTLYFYSYTEPGYGNADIFVSKRLDGSWTKWSKPKNLGKKINSINWDVYYTVAAKGDYAYLVSSENSYGNYDIFQLKLTDIEKPDPVVLVYGKVIDNKNGKPITASIVYENDKTGKTEGLARSNPITGEYKIVLPYGVKYNIRANKDGYFAMNEMIDLSEINIYNEVEKDLFMSPLEEEEAILLKDVHFYTTKAILLPASFPELNRLVNLMRKHSTMVIEIHGHTESTAGYEVQLMNLSEKRAEAVKQYLIIKGISSERIKKKAFGGTKPVADNNTEQGRKKNRRVEFRIIKK